MVIAAFQRVDRRKSLRYPSSAAYYAAVDAYDVACAAADHARTAVWSLCVTRASRLPRASTAPAPHQHRAERRDGLDALVGTLALPPRFDFVAHYAAP